MIVYMQSLVRVASYTFRLSDARQPKTETAAQMIAAQRPALSPMMVTSLSQTGHLPSL